MAQVMNGERSVNCAAVSVSLPASYVSGGVGGLSNVYPISRKATNLILYSPSV